MKVTCLTLTAMSVNTYFCVCDLNDSAANVEKKAVIIDPGGEPNRLIQFITDENIKIMAILLTHGHFDHIGAVEKIRANTGASVYVHSDEAELIGDGRLNMSVKMRRMPIEVTPDVLVNDGDELVFENIKCKVIHLPGHTPGGAAYYFEQDKVLFSGDVLFFQSIGRSDFECGNAGMLIDGIREKLFILPEDVAVYPGHGSHTTIGYEKKNNPYIKG